MDKQNAEIYLSDSEVDLSKETRDYYFLVHIFYAFSIMLLRCSYSIDKVTDWRFAKINF